MRLQSVELRVADVSGTAGFFEQLWGLRAAGYPCAWGPAEVRGPLELHFARPS